MTVTLPTWFDDEVVDEPSIGTGHLVVRLGGGRYAVRATDVAEVLPVFGFYLQPAVGGATIRLHRTLDTTTDSHRCHTD